MFESINIVFLDQHYWMFNLGIALNRYEEINTEEQTQWVRKELDIGFLVMSIRLNWIFKKQKIDRGG